MRSRSLVRALALLCALLPFPASAAIAAERHSKVRIVSAPKADEIERRYATLLAERLRIVSKAPVTIGGPEPGFAGIQIHLGTAESDAAMVELASALGIDPPVQYDPGKEGFVLASRTEGRGLAVFAIGADRRGVLYAVGEILRQAVGRGDSIEFPNGLRLRRAPRWPMRGLIVGQGETIRSLTNSRHWTEAELQQAHLDYALAGANTFELGATGKKSRALVDFLESYGLDTLTVIGGNDGSGPPEWRAKEAIGRQGYLSPGIPEARAELIKQREAIFKSMPSFDYVHIKSGDGGGDESEVSAPYGGALIRLCEDYAPLLRKYHPNIKIFVGNQKLDNAGDRAILAYLQEKPRDWLSGIVYGPGSNAMGWTPGRRQDHRMDLFEYGGRGAMGGYLRELLHQLPPQQSILLFTDLTHWVYSQYGLMDHELIPDRDHNLPPAWDSWMYESRPDPAMAQVYDRRTFHARPRNYHKVFQETSPYVIGDVAYSEGHHDHANCWTYQRMWWEPHQSVESVVGEYARAHFGPEAAPTMAEAIFLVEQNIQTPIANNPGIDKLIELVRAAGNAMEPSLMARNHLWREYMQKALLDKYIQLDVRLQRAFCDERIEKLRAALKSGSTKSVGDALAKEPLPPPTEEMKMLKEEAARLGEESDRLYGVRSEGFFNLAQDYHGYGWLKREIGRAADAPTEEARRAIADRIVNYEDPGPGGFYDDAGSAGRAPRMVNGWAFGEEGFSPSNRPSQRTMAFTTDEKQGVAFRYKGLDPNAQYRVRLALMRPSYLPRYAMFQPQTKQSIYADDTALAEEIEVPEHLADFFEYDIPKSATADGELLIWMKKQAGVGEGLASDVTIWRNTGGWGTVVSEIWLMKK